MLFNFCNNFLTTVYWSIIFTQGHLRRHHFLHLHSTKTYISLNKRKIFPKEKRHSSLLWHSHKFRAVTPCEAWRNTAMCSVFIHMEMIARSIAEENRVVEFYSSHPKFFRCGNQSVQNAHCRPGTKCRLARYKMQTAVQNADCRLQTTDYRLQTAIMDESVDTFEQNKFFLSASFRNLKTHLFWSIASPPLPLFNVAIRSSNTFTWLQHWKREKGSKCHNWRLKNSLV